MSASSEPTTTKTPDLDRELAQYNVPLVYEGVGGVEFQVPEDTKLSLLAALNEAFTGGADARPAIPTSLPDRAAAKCHAPEWLAEHPAWGISLQLYELRSNRNWGIGDFEDLAKACELAAASGASFVGLTPLHALFMAEPQRCSPYSPSNRSFLNPIFIAVDRLDDKALDAELAAEADLLRDAPTVDYENVGRVKLAALRKHWRVWCGETADAAAAAEFHEFVAQGGNDLRAHALFEALSLRMVNEGYGSGWRSWPPEYRDHEGPAVRAFERDNADEVDFHLWLQWVAARQLAEAGERGKQAGLELGLYFDYAVGEDPDGSATWSNPRDYLSGFGIGAPPDPFSESGQDWGLSVPSPASFVGEGGMRRRRQFDRIMTAGGMFRLDHVMGLWQLFLVPVGDTALNGAYLRYPINESLQLLSEASQQASTVVIGEDLGNVPPGFRELLQSANVFSYRVLYFEDIAKQPIERFPPLSLVCISTHDLYPLAGWWAGSDIEARVDLGLSSAESGEVEKQDRLKQKETVLKAIAKTGISDGVKKDPAGPLTAQLTAQVHALLARSPCMLLAARLADLIGEAQATNIPGTPADMNWRRKVDVPLEAWASHPLFRSVTGVLAKERPRRR